MKVVFFDTNVVLDFLGERPLFYGIVSQLISLSEKGKFHIVVSPVTFVNVNYILSKSENKISALEKLVKFKTLCQISKIDSKTIEKSLQSKFTDFEDAVQHYSAQEYSCDFIITRDLKDFRFSEISVLSPLEFLKTFI